MKEITILPSVTHEAAASQGTRPTGDGSFSDLFEKAVSEVNKAQVEADQAVEQVQSGQSGNLHEAMIALEQADISLRLMVQMRNKILDAYQEIMRMQV